MTGLLVTDFFCRGTKYAKALAVSIQRVKHGNFGKSSAGIKINGKLFAICREHDQYTAMEIIPNEQFPQRDAAGLRQFFEHCRAKAQTDGAPVYASISLRVAHIDPLAVLQSIYEPQHWHCYAECPRDEFALAGAEAVTSMQVPAGDENRFSRIKEAAEAIFARTVAIGDLEAPFAGPHVFTAFTFAETGGDEQPVASAFLPRWQVGVWQGQYTAVANAEVAPDTDVDFLTQKILAAHEKFSRFDYGNAQLPPADASNRIVRLTEPGGGLEAFKDAVSRALEAIEAGQFEKIVISRAVDLELSTPLQPLQWLNRLRERFQTCHSLSFRTDAPGSFIAATPERLVKVHDGRLVSEAIAGSTPRSNDAREDARLGAGLLASEKNLREHQAVIDSIRQRLESLGLAVDVGARPRLLKLHNVQHLRTPIEAALPQGIHLLDAAAVLHPTPAVGGRPRERALEIIPQLEGYPRGHFTGALGWLDYRGDGELLVGIRCAQVNGTHARLYAGAGIVAGSDPAAELAETDLKLQALRSLL